MSTSNHASHHLSSRTSSHSSSSVDIAAMLGVTIGEELCELALTHRSFAYENGGIAHNERLEFLGDAILGQAVTVMLFTENPSLEEGDLAKRRAALVSTTALAEIARRIGLGQFIRLGNGEELTGGRDKDSILADTVEALIGAAFIANGPDEATELVLRLVRPLLSDAHRFGAAMDPKTSLQERAAKLSDDAPIYVIVAEGPDHARVFTATVMVGTLVSAEGTGTSKKHAEMAAALTAWTMLENA